MEAISFCGRFFISNLPEGASAGLEVFGSHVQKLVPPTTDRAALHSELKGLTLFVKDIPYNERHTAVWEALLAASNVFESPEEGDAIYLFSDAYSNSGKATPHDVAEKLRRKQIRLFWFLGNAPQENGIAVSSEPRALEELVSETGGAQFRAQPSKLDRAYPFVDKNGSETGAAHEIRTQFRLILDFYQLELGLPAALQR
jgi:hypothetical protein